MTRGMRRLSSAAVLVGAAALLFGFVTGRRPLVLALLDASFLFCAGVAAGGVALSASVRLAFGGWAGPLLPAAEGLVDFLLPALGLLVVLVLEGAAWKPRPLSAGLAIRDLGGGILLFLVARWYVTRRRRGEPIGAPAVIYLLLYAAVLSTWAVDLVLDLGPWAPSTVVPAYYFMSALLAGLAWATLQILARERGEGDPELHHDAGKLVFGLVCFWGYLLFAGYLPVWYENLPDETGFLLARWHGAFRPLSLLTLAATGLVPFAILLTEWAKRRRALLAAGTASVLVGVLVECLLLVLPSLPLQAGATGGVLGAGVLVGSLGLVFWFAPAP